jgi:predicted DCC family thiol-disulfide oxidoreductase YuxK
LEALPAPLADWLYDRIARNRYRLFGQRDRCLLPDDKVRARFLQGL